MTPVFTEAALGLAIMCQAAWLYRLARTGLLPRYAALGAYLALSSAVGAAYVVLNYFQVRLGGEQAYFWLYAAVRPFMWLLLYGLLYSVYSGFVRSYGGLQRLGRIVFYTGVAGFLAVLTFVFYAHPYPVSEPKAWGRLWLGYEQSVHISVAACVVGLLILKRFFALSVARNVQTVLSVFGVYFVGYAACLVLRSYGGEPWNATLNLAGGVLAAVCIGYGAFRFSPAGETVVADVRLMESDGVRAEKLRVARERLETVNFELMRALAK